MSWIRENRGFISIPIIIAIVVGIFAVGTAGYVGVTTYTENKSTTEKGLIQRIEDLEKQVGSAPTSTVEAVIEEEVAETPALNKTTQTSEPNAASVIADYYEDIALGPVNIALELFSSYSSELDRYIQGIPTVATNFKLMIRISFDSSTVRSETERAIDDWEDGYIDDFTDLKNIVDGIYQKLKEQQSLLVRISGDLRTQYVPLSQSDSYTNEIDKYSDQTNLWIEDVRRAHNTLTTRFIDDKDNTNELIYQAGSNNTTASSAPLPTYYPPSLNISTYRPPVTTYCNSFGSSFSCTSYSW